MFLNFLNIRRKWLINSHTHQWGSAHMRGANRLPLNGISSFLQNSRALLTTSHTPACNPPPDYYAAAGADPRGRMIEMVGLELEDNRLLIFHAMRLTAKMADGLCIRKENR